MSEGFNRLGLALAPEARTVYPKPTELDYTSCVLVPLVRDGLGRNRCTRVYLVGKKKTIISEYMRGVRSWNGERHA